MYEMLTGVTPLKADSPLALLRQVIDVEPRDVGELRPEVPESLRAILRKMMAGSHPVLIPGKSRHGQALIPTRKPRSLSVHQKPKAIQLKFRCHRVGGETLFRRW